MVNVVSDRPDLSLRAAEADAAREQRRRLPARTQQIDEEDGTMERPLYTQSDDVRTHQNVSTAGVRSGYEDRSRVQDPRVEMQVMSQPESESRRDVTLYPPLAVRLSVRDHGADGSGTAIDMSHLWAFVSLTDEEGIEPLAPPGEGLLRGRLTDSAHPLLRADHLVDGDGLGLSSPVAEETSGCFVMFPDLAILEPGRYRFRITLVSMQTGAELTAVRPAEALSLQEVQTGVIEIQDRPRREDPST